MSGTFFAIQFYADVEGHTKDAAVALALEELAYFSVHLRVLSTYPRIPSGPRWPNRRRTANCGRTGLVDVRVPDRELPGPRCSDRAGRLIRQLTVNALSSVAAPKPSAPPEASSVDAWTMYVPATRSAENENSPNSCPLADVA